MGALKHETVMVRCEVDANPPIVTFSWTFNNSGDVADVPYSKITSDATTSRLNYTPVADMDYGTLACWGSNAVGRQRTPCIFQVVAAGKNLSRLKLTLSCSLVHKKQFPIIAALVKIFEAFSQVISQTVFLRIFLQNLHRYIKYLQQQWNI